MRLSSARRRVAWIGLTPLIDVVFLLLIFFMLASTFLRFSGVPVSGATRGGAPTGLKELALIQVRNSTQVSVNGQVVDFDALARLIDEFVARGIVRAIVRPGPEATVQDVVDALEVARSTRLESIVVAP